MKRSETKIRMYRALPSTSLYIFFIYFVVYFFALAIVFIYIYYLIQLKWTRSDLEFGACARAFLCRVLVQINTSNKIAESKIIKKKPKLSRARRVNIWLNSFKSKWKPNVVSGHKCECERRERASEMPRINRQLKNEILFSSRQAPIPRFQWRIQCACNLLIIFAERTKENWNREPVKMRRPYGTTCKWIEFWRPQSFSVRFSSLFGVLFSLVAFIVICIVENLRCTDSTPSTRPKLIENSRLVLLRVCLLLTHSHTQTK